MYPGLRGRSRDLLLLPFLESGTDKDTITIGLNAKGRRMKAYLILEDGTVFTGKSIGSTKEIIRDRI